MTRGMKNAVMVRYQGAPQLTGTLGQLLLDEDVDLDFDRILRRWTDTDAMIVYFVCHGDAAAVDTAVQRFREQDEPGAAVDVVGGPRPDRS